MTRNDTLDKLEWYIRPCSGRDSAQWDGGITEIAINVARDQNILV